MDYVVHFEKVLAQKANGLTEKYTLRFDTKLAAMEWIDGIRKIDKEKTYVNFKLMESV
jgi:hypothetical protein